MSDSQDIPYGYCRCGCGEQTTVANRNHANHGMRKGEPMRFCVGHSRRPWPRWLEEDCGYDTPCWLWRGTLDRLGYGRLGKGDGRPHLAHVLVYTEMRGAVPDDLELDHLCRVRQCVNPDHLEAVTHAENMRRGAVAKLTVEQEHEIRRELELGEQQRVIGRRFGVSQTAIWAIANGRTWKGV